MPGVIVKRSTLIARMGSWLSAAVVVTALTGCARPGERALVALERGLDELMVLAERRDRGELDDKAFGEALASWERTGRAIERLSVEAARSAGPEERAELEGRWRALSARLGVRLSAISSPPPTLGE